MRFSELCDREVVNAEDCRCLGRIKDIDFDPECGQIHAVIIPGPGKFLGFICRDFEFCIPWRSIKCIGPDVILVHLDEDSMRRKIL